LAAFRNIISAVLAASSLCCWGEGRVVEGEERDGGWGVVVVKERPPSLVPKTKVSELIGRIDSATSLNPL
jgi:hypothetical protein